MVKDIAEIISALDTIRKEWGGSSTKHATLSLSPKKSISRMAMDGIADFPVVVEDTLSVEEGMMIARSLEKRFASFLMVVMSMDPTFDMSKDGTTMADYLKQFHQNMNVDGDIIGGAKLSLESVSTEKLLNVAESLGVEYSMFVDEAVGILHTIYEGVNSHFVNKEAAKLNFTIEEVTESAVLNDVGKVVLEAGKLTPGSSTKFDNKNSDPKQRQPLVNAEFKKANDVVPTLLHVRVFPKGTDQKEPIDFIIGVHASLHPISQSDMVLNLVRGLRNEDKFFNFIRWTTGETKFFRDFLFGLDQMKIDATTSSGSSNALFSVGRKRKALSTIKNRFTKESLMPNMTTVVSTDCLARLKDEYGYDINMNAGATQMALIRKMMNTYFMFGFVIVDPGLQRVNIFVDGDSRFESYTYANLQREGTVNDKQFKEMMKMLGRSV